MTLPVAAYRRMLDDLTTALTGLVVTGANVFEDRADAIATGRIPAVVVEPANIERTEEAEFDDDGFLERHGLHVYVYSIAATKEERDTSGAEVQQQILNVLHLGRRRWLHSAAFDRMGEGERELFAIRQRFVFEYLVDSRHPDQVIQHREGTT